MASGPAPARRAVASWTVYDLANTIFSFNILSFYFPVWAKDHLGAADAHIAVAFSGSMVLVALVSPLAGALSDRASRRMPFLVATTVMCVATTAILGVGGLGTALILYAAASFFFEIGLVFYDALLPDVSTPESVGIVGGAGVGIGYLGSLVGLAVGAVLLATTEDPHPLIFLATAALFLALAIPCFLFVREAPRPSRLGGLRFVDVAADLRRTAADVVRIGPLGRFLLSRFLYADAANTMIIFMGIYATRDAGFTQEEAQSLLAAGILAAVLGGFAFGRAVDRLGAKPVLALVLWLWVAALAAAIAIPVLDIPRDAFWLVALLSGASLGGTWASDRPLMLRLTPAGRVGEFYGVYGMVGRFSAVLGPLLWGLIVDGLGWGRPAAIGALLVMMLVAWVVLRGVEAR